MKKSIFIILLIGIFYSCNKNVVDADKDYIVSRWKLTAVLSDPGDGSGVFQSVNSNKDLVFWSNGIVTSTGNLCDMSIESNASSSGTYSATNLTITPSACSDRKLWYTSQADT